MLKMKPSLVALSCSLAMASSFAAEIPLRIVETSDIHTNFTDFDYYKDKANPKYGFTRTATRINEARNEATNMIYVDNGDLIQGAPIGDYQAHVGAKGKHPGYLALETAGATVSTLGNHEFNYGLAFLDHALKNSRVPVINANVLDAKTKKHRFTPHLIQTLTLKDTDGKAHKVKVGFIGFVPPQILIWDRANLNGKVVVEDIIESAKKQVAELKRKGVDVIIALNHSGLGDFDGKYEKGQENTTVALSKVKGIDAIVFGHSHGEFPSKEYAGKTGVDVEKGTINGVPATMPGQFGSHVGVLDLRLSNAKGKWAVIDGKAALRPIYDNGSKKALVENDPAMSKAMQPYHDATREFVGQPIGRSNADMYSYLSLVQDDPTVQIVNLAQKAYVEEALKSLPKYQGLPVLSAAAPFKSGGRRNDPTSFVEVPKGELSLRNAADLYLYPNTLVAVKVNGAELKDWLECSAGMFNQIDANSTAPQGLLNWDGFRTYNYDVIDGVNYQIDLTQPAKFDGECKVVNPAASRITSLTFNGKAVDPKAEFIVATNNYRAYGGKFAGTGDDHVIYAAPDENRQALASYISAVSKAQGAVDPRADHNWSFSPIRNANLNVFFETANSDKAKAFIEENAVRPYRFQKQDDQGFAVYQIDLSSDEPASK